MTNVRIAMLLIFAAFCISSCEAEHLIIGCWSIFAMGWLSMMMIFVGSILWNALPCDEKELT